MSTPFPAAVPGRGAGLRAERRLLTSFDGGVSELAQVVRPDRYRDLEMPISTPRVVRGGGYSYAAASFGGGAIVQDVRSFDRILEFDPATRSVRCEAGITLGKLYRFAIRHGLCLAVQPGHPDITVGGCIAADSHGKNPARDGTFRRQLSELTLFHPRRGEFKASRVQAAEVFELTCGGYGLTGQILDATLQLADAPRAYELRKIPVPDLAATGPLLDEWASRAAVLYSWNDLTARGRGFGRGFLVVGHALEDGPPAPVPGSYQRLPSSARSKLLVWTRLMTRSFNRVYGAHRESRAAVRRGTFEVLFPITSKAAYFRLFGAQGLQEMQLLVPRAAFEDFARALAAIIGRTAVAPTLGSCKLFAGEPGLLRFDGGGVAVAIDFPRNRRGAEFCSLVDELGGVLGCLPNVIKDSRLPRSVVERCFPGCSEFRRRLRTFDDARLYRSELSERLGL